MSSKRTHKADAPAPAPTEEPREQQEPVPSDAPGLEPEESPPEPVPAFAEEEEPSVETAADPDTEPLPKEYVVLTSNASYGPVMINGARVMAQKDKLYHVPDLAERADILGTGRFRAASVGDLGRAGSPSAGRGGAITRDLLPPGAIKGGLIKP